MQWTPNGIGPMDSTNCSSHSIGGSVPVFDEIVVSLSNMNSVRSFDSVSGKWISGRNAKLEPCDNNSKLTGSLCNLGSTTRRDCVRCRMYSRGAGQVSGGTRLHHATGSGRQGQVYALLFGSRLL
jgi:hypothetical protein